MKKSKLFRCLIAGIAFLGAPLAGHADSLLEVYQQALQSDPLIHEADARRLAAMEAAPQARSVLFPQLSAGGRWDQSTRTGLSQQSIVNPDDPNDIVGFRSVDTESDLDSFSWQADLRQTLFRWDQFVGLKQANKRVAKAEVDFEAAQQDLIIRVATRYFDVLAAEDILTSIHADRQAIARQLEQAKQRFEVGLIAITDVQESQAAYDQSIADEIAAKRSLATSRQFLREITGEYVDSLSAPVENFPLNTPNPVSEESWLDLAMAQNLALVSSRLDEEIARDEIAFRRTGHYPTVDLVANYSDFDGDVSNVTVDGQPAFNPDFPTAQTDTTIGIQFTLPIFEGGRVTSRVRESVYLHRASMEQLQRVVRETERATRDAYLGVLAEISRVKALAQAVESSQTALEATQAGFEVGTRTIVDVLNSQQALYVAITNYYRSRYAYIGNVLLLKQAAGTLQVQDLEEIDRFMIDRRPPEEVIREEEEAARKEAAGG